MVKCFTSGGADGDKGRSRKWKTLLAFPHISNCLYLKNCLGIHEMILLILSRADLSYDFIVEQQPIGKRLFRLFCRSNNFISDVVDFVDSIVRFIILLCIFHLQNTFAVCIPNERQKIGLEIYRRFLSDMVTHPFSYCTLRVAKGSMSLETLTITQC